MWTRGYMFLLILFPGLPPPLGCCLLPPRLGDPTDPACRGAAALGGEVSFEALKECGAQGRSQNPGDVDSQTTTKTSLFLAVVVFFLLVLFTCLLARLQKYCSFAPTPTCVEKNIAP